MWITWPPAASIRAAAAITSITMNGGTSLRPDAFNRRPARSRNVASCMDICYLTPVHTENGALVPRTSRIRRFLRTYRLSRPQPITIDRTMLSIAPHSRTARVIAFATALVTAAAPMAASAQGIPVVRDSESEQLLRDYTRPILRAAGMEKQNIQMVIINEVSFNAFVADGRRIFVNTGAIMQSETPNQIIGVLAHETGHLAGGHLAKIREQLANAQTQLIIAMLLGAGAMVAGARSGNPGSGLTQAGAAAVQAPQEVIRRSLLSYQRQQEENADRAGVKYLTATGQSARGMYETFKRFTSDSLFAARGADP